MINTNQNRRRFLGNAAMAFAATHYFFLHLQQCLRKCFVFSEGSFIFSEERFVFSEK